MRKEKSMNETAKRIVTIVGLSIAIGALMLPSMSTVVPALPDGKRLWMVEDNNVAETHTFSQVRHKFRSWFYRNTIAEEEDRDFRVSLLYIEKRYTGWFDHGKSALSYAYLRQSSYNVDIPYTSNYKQGQVGLYLEIPLYFYAPTDGSADGANGVGTMYPLRYVEIKYDVPNTFKNHVYRSGGTYLRNSCYSYKSSIRYSDAAAWQWVVAANAAHFDPGSGYEIKGYTYSDSWYVYWSWSCWCYKVKHKYDSWYWEIDY